MALSYLHNRKPAFLIHRDVKVRRRRRAHATDRANPFPLLHGRAPAPTAPRRAFARCSPAPPF